MRDRLLVILTAAVVAIAATASALRLGWVPLPGGGDAPERDGAAVSASNGLVQRHGPALTFRLKNGAAMTLTDRTRCGDLACPRSLAARYAYLGWDETAGGYRIDVAAPTAVQVVLPFAEDATLIDAGHAPPAAGTPTPMPAPPPAFAGDAGLADWLNQTAGGRDQSEAPRIAESGGRAARSGQSLILTLGDRRQLTLTDDLACGQVVCPARVFRAFEYAGLATGGRYFAVEVHWDEGSSAVLVDGQTGAVTALPGKPVFSPDGKRAAAAVEDLELPAPNRLEVWSLTGEVPAMEFQLPARRGDDMVYKIVGWDDPDHLRLRRGPWASREPGTAMLAHDAAGWHLENGESSN